MGDLFIMNGRVVDPANGVDGKLCILVRGGRVVEVTSSRKVPGGCEVLDAKGCIVAPGFIDMHVHLREPGEEHKEDIESGCRAAAAGGFTSICCMPNTRPPNDCAAVTEFILGRARSAGRANVFPIGAISRGLAGETLADIGDMARAGAVAISDDGRGVMDASLMRRAMEYAKAFRLPIVSHCEDHNLSGQGVMHEGALATQLGLKGIPAAAEDAIVARETMLAGLTGCPCHIAHISTRGAVELVKNAKARGLPITAEVTPHHLTLTDEAASDYDPSAKVKPPLRAEADRLALVRALADGTIDAVASDHAPHAVTDKEVGFQEAAFGMIGLETALPLTLGLVHERKLALKRMIEALTAAPARIFNLAERGALSKGAPADITIFDPDAAWTIQPHRFASKARNTPFAGMRVHGKVRWTIVAGRIAYSEQQPAS